MSSLSFCPNLFSQLLGYYFPLASKRRLARYHEQLDEFYSYLHDERYDTIESFFVDMDRQEVERLQVALSLYSAVDLASTVNVLLAIDAVANYLYEHWQFDYRFDSSRLERAAYAILVQSAVAGSYKQFEQCSLCSLPSNARGTPHFVALFPREVYVDIVAQSRDLWGIAESVENVDALVLLEKPLTKREQRTLVQSLLDQLIPAAD